MKPAASLSRSSPRFLALARIVGEKQVHIDDEFYRDCHVDAIKISRTPLAAVEVTTAEQLPEIIRIARDERFPLIPRGAGTGLTGGAVAERDGVVVSLALLNRILELDTQSQLAIVEPGVITQEVADAAAQVGLFYPPDPASLKESTIGGNVAECAGGLQCKKYGVTRDYVLGMEGYTMDGELLRTGYFAPDAPLDLTSLVIGSEGTLCFITKIALQLITPPESRRSYLMTFARQEDAAAVVAASIGSGVVPAVLEFMDGDAVALALNYLGWVDMKRPEAVLLLELDGSVAEIERDHAILDPLIRQNNPLAFESTPDGARREHLWTLRRSISPAVAASAPIRLCEDVCVPPSQFPSLIKHVVKLGKAHDLRVLSFGHAGDGNLHVYLMADKDNEETHQRIDNASADLLSLAVELDGTISGEHGIGITKRKYLPLEISSTTMEVLRKVKGVFDPEELLNPDKIF
jgi:glycolate oxidase